VKPSAYIYALLDPDTDEVHYIGKTEYLDRRFGAHMQANPAKSKKRAEWIRGLINEGKKPKLLVLEVRPFDDWVEAERDWIAYYRSLNAPLKNVHKGGEGGTRFENKTFRRWQPQN
jgi:hypothetical protein